MRKQSFRFLPYFISNYLLFGIFILCRSEINIVNGNSYLSSSKTKTYFDENHNPDYFYHLTDIHIKHYNNKTMDQLRKALSIGVSYKSDFLLISGDVVDNFGYGKGLEIKQIIEDWEEYHTVMEESAPKYKKIVEALGNHDAADVSSINSDNFYYRNYSQVSKYIDVTKSMEDFEIFVFDFGNFTHIILNPYTLSYKHGRFVYMPFPSPHLLDRLEEEIKKADESKTLIVSTHYNGDTWRGHKSSKGHTLIDILNNRKVDLFITGHEHGYRPVVVHHRDAIEVIGPDLGEACKGGFVTEDNGIPVYHGIDIFHPESFFVTYPPPLEQTKKGTKINPFVRVIAFDKEDHFTVSIDDGKSVKLSFVREIKDGVYLFSAHLENVPKGKHKLTIKGNQNQKTFDIMTDNEIVNDTSYNKYFVVMFFTLYAVGIFVTFPFDILLFENYNKWIHNNENDDNTVINWLLTLFFGFVGIRGRIAKLEKSMRLLLFLYVIGTPFILNHNYHVSNDISFSINIGNLISGRVNYECFYGFQLFSFIAVTVSPVIAVFSSIAFLIEEKNFLIAFVDLMIYCASAIYSCHIGLHERILLDDSDDDIHSNSVFILFVGMWITIITIYLVYCFVSGKLTVETQEKSFDDNAELLLEIEYEEEEEEEEEA